MSYTSNKLSGWIKLLIAILIIALIVTILIILANKIPQVNTFFVNIWTWIKDLFTGKLFKKK